MKLSVNIKPSLWDLLPAAVVLALAVLCGAVFWGRALAVGTDALTAVVSVNGEEADRVVLSGLEGEQTRTYTHNGYTLTVDFSADGVCVAQSDCPNQDCVRTGTISRAGESIVCLPARISVQLTGAKAADGVDAVIG